MADGVTTNYSFTQPEVGASQDNWGGKLNTNWSSLDTFLKALDDDLQGQIDDILSVSFTQGDGIALTGDLNTSINIAADIADAAALRSGTANKLVDAASVYSASAFVTLTDAASISPDFNAGRNFVVTLGDDRTLDNPTNQTPGQSGAIVIKQDATGGRTLAYGSHWRFVAGLPAIAPGSNDISMIGYIVLESGIVLANRSVNFTT